MITQSIYMGSIMSAMDKDNLKKIGITHIINCIGKEESEKFPNYESIDGIEYMYINMGSSNQADLSQYPESTCVFIENALKVNGKILIHCKRGMNRSGSIVIAYIMNKFRMPFDDAYKFVQSKRSICKIDDNLAVQLKARQTHQAISEMQKLHGTHLGSLLSYTGHRLDTQ